MTDPAVAMYHPHAHGQMTIPNGMWGAMIFSPPGGEGSADYTIPRGRTISGVEIPADLEVGPRSTTWCSTTPGRSACR